MKVLHSSASNAMFKVKSKGAIGFMWSRCSSYRERKRILRISFSTDQRQKMLISMTTVAQVAEEACASLVL